MVTVRYLEVETCHPFPMDPRDPEVCSETTRLGNRFQGLRLESDVVAGSVARTEIWLCER